MFEIIIFIRINAYNINSLSFSLIISSYNFMAVKFMRLIMIVFSCQSKAYVNIAGLGVRQIQRRIRSYNYSRDSGIQVIVLLILSYMLIGKSAIRSVVDL